MFYKVCTVSFAVEPDPVDQYLEETARGSKILSSSGSLKRKHDAVDAPTPGPSGQSTTRDDSASPPTKRLRRSERHRKSISSTVSPEETDPSSKTEAREEIRKKVTCGMYIVHCLISIVIELVN